MIRKSELCWYIYNRYSFAVEIIALKREFLHSLENGMASVIARQENNFRRRIREKNRDRGFEYMALYWDVFARDSVHPSSRGK